jgi:hypothetical protein
MPATSTAATPCRRPRSTAKAARLFAVILVSSPALTTAAAEITRRSPDDVAGRDPAAGAAFAAHAQGDIVTVELELRGGKRVTARVDHAAGIVRLRSLAAGPDGAEAPAPVGQADLRALAALPREFGELPSGNARDALEGLLALLDEAPPGIVLDVDRKADIRSLCGVRRATGTYTLGSQRVSQRVAVGPCYDEANRCLGRCGRGCRSTSVLGISNPGAVQRFTQDCLDHDLCVDRTGDALGACTGEFLAAVDDFLLAPDCGSLSGGWTDNLGEVWRLVQGDGGSVRGTVTLPRCGRLDVRGRHEGSSVTLGAAGSSACPGGLDYAGRFRGCDAARGTVSGARDGRWLLERGGR